MAMETQWNPHSSFLVVIAQLSLGCKQQLLFVHAAVNVTTQIGTQVYYTMVLLHVLLCLATLPVLLLRLVADR